MSGGGSKFEIIFPKEVGDWVKPFSLPQEKLAPGHQQTHFFEGRLGPWLTSFEDWMRTEYKPEHPGEFCAAHGLFTTASA